MSSESSYDLKHVENTSLILRNLRDVNKRLLAVKAESDSIRERIDDAFDKMPEEEFRRARDKGRHLRTEQLDLEQGICDMNCELSILELTKK